MQRAHPAATAFRDEQDRDTYLASLADSARREDVKVHAFALLDHEVHLLVTPKDTASVSRLMQSVGRQYVSACHRRHGGHGTLWAGRFHCALVEDGPMLLDVLRLIDALGSDPSGGGRSSFGHRTSDSRLPLLTDPPEVWALGNTPFERQARWRELLAEGLPSQLADRLRAAVRGGRVIGSELFQQQVAQALGRAVSPRPRGRPPSHPRH